jgi:shikimate dehydrogenase
MIKAGVIGHPISHSKSPRIHGYWLGKYAIAGEYKTYDIAPDHLGDGIEKLKKSGLVGFNVTLPHKQKMMDFCSDLSETAQSIGAVNTIIIREDGTLYGHNTDAYGFSQNLETTLPDYQWTDKQVAVIGAGGAARAIVYALRAKSVAGIKITNRTQETASELAQRYQAEVVAWQDRHAAITGADLVINTTSLGMTGHPPLDIDLSALGTASVAYDIVYSPLQTPFLRHARAAGAQIVTGIGMLLHQARPGFSAWFGKEPEVTRELEELLLTST